MNTKDFCVSKEVKYFKFSSLDYHKNTGSHKGLQGNVYNCSVWVLMEMFNCGDGPSSRIRTKIHEELVAYCIRLFYLLIKTYATVCADNDWVFEWETNNVMKVPLKWRKVFIASFNDDFDYNSRWFCDVKKHLWF